MTREPVNTDGHPSTWLWHWVCDRTRCRTAGPGYPKRDLPSPEAMHDLGWFIARHWGDRCPACVTAGRVDDVEAMPLRPAARPVETVELS